MQYGQQNENETKRQNGELPEKSVPVNSIDSVLYTARLPQYNYANMLGNSIYLYGKDNLYPQKVAEIALRSTAMQTAIKTKHRFFMGKTDGIPDIELNSEGFNLYEMLDFAALQFINLGFAFHCKYNVFGELIEIYPVHFEQVREGVKTQERPYKYWILNRDWSNQQAIFNRSKDEELILRDFNPENARAEMLEDGEENYNGQLYYFHTQYTRYPFAYYDSALDYAQMQAETALAGLARLQNGFMSNGVLKIFQNADEPEVLQNIDSNIRSLKGAPNAGRILRVTIPPSIDVGLNNAYESMDSPDVSAQLDLLTVLSKKEIYELFGQSEILNGRSSTGMFNQEQMQDAFDMYNSIVEPERVKFFKGINKLLGYFAPVQIPEIETEKLIFQSNRNGSTNYDSGRAGEDDSQQES